MRLKKLTLSLLTLCLFTLLAGNAMAEQAPIERVKEGADKLIKILSDHDMQDPAKHDAAIHVLRATAEEYIDFRLVTMYSVGKPWLKMSKQMQKDLTEAFVQLLERTYLRQIPAYDGQKIDYKKELVSGKKAKVTAEIIDKDKKIVVEFRLKNIKGVWMIYDMVAEGVSLVANYRSQFSEVLSNGTAEELLGLIQKRIKKLDAKNADEAEAKS